MNENNITADQFGVFVARLSDLDDYNFKRVIKITKQFRKAQRMLEDEQYRITEERKKSSRVNATRANIENAKKSRKNVLSFG